ncbi:predicted protein [Nematostella vectensis]|uniref:MYND-type domain-containing protein n=1 Tax=Nematostella vectensis TaxID=45351 RepID=A7SBM3_NEMVE|nr:predicted protein [Nematostella vectensis]|eukprot:XP_001630959.1 predicted protein [Nematostella vectensis]
MYLCVGKNSSKRNARRTPDYTDILPISPTKIIKPKFMDTGEQNGFIAGYTKPKGGRLHRLHSLNLDVNANEHTNEGESKSSTLPRRHTTKSPPPKPPRVIPPKPPRLMEKKVFTCENPHCQKKEELLGIVELTFKSCKACFTHYCSPECRILHWPEHRLDCQYGNIECQMVEILNLCQTSPKVHFFLSEITRKNYTRKGRGALMLIFLSPTSAELFVKSGTEFFNDRRNTPSYSSMREIKNAGVHSKYQKELLEAVGNYSPIHEFVINVAIVVGRTIQTTPVPRNKVAAVIRHIKVPLHPEFNSRTLSPQNSQEHMSPVSPQKLSDIEVLGNTVRRKSL